MSWYLPELSHPVTSLQAFPEHSGPHPAGLILAGADMECNLGNSHSKDTLTLTDSQT